MTLLIWVGFGVLAVLMLLVIVGLFVEERALEVPRIYDDQSPH